MCHESEDHGTCVRVICPPTVVSRTLRRRCRHRLLLLLLLLRASPTGRWWCRPHWRSFHLPLLCPRRLGRSSSLLGQHKIGPGLRSAYGQVFANDICKCFHPSIFLSGAVGVEIDGLAIGEADAETFFDEHVAFFLLCEGGFPPRATLRCSLCLHQRRFVVDQLAGFP